MNCANHPDRERISFCQNCGKPLCAECIRSVGTAIFCEPCLAARLAAADAATNANYGTSPNFAAASVPGTPSVPGMPNPVAAGALGLIPGVGAMYNGQYAKGVVHLVVFVVLVSLADSYGPLGILVAGWIFYQVFEAYHTARARRDGIPLPNPFGLNDIGERFGFHRSWTAPAAAPMPGPAVAYSAHAGVPFVPTPSTPFHQEPPAGQTAYASAWGAPQDAYTPVPPFPGAYTPPYTDPQLGRNRFPVGAIWLIGLGLLFFFGSSGFFFHFPIHRLIPFLLIGLGIWLFVRKMTGTGMPLSDDGSPAYRLRVFRALRGPVWIILVGVLFLLDTLHVLGWGRSWPLFIIVAGLMTIFERSAYSAAGPVPLSYPGPVSPPVPPSVEPVPESSATPFVSRDIPTGKEES